MAYRSDAFGRLHQERGDNSKGGRNEGHSIHWRKNTPNNITRSLATIPSESSLESIAKFYDAGDNSSTEDNVSTSQPTQSFSHDRLPPPHDFPSDDSGHSINDLNVWQSVPELGKLSSDHRDGENGSNLNDNTANLRDKRIVTLNKMVGRKPEEIYGKRHIKEVEDNPDYDQSVRSEFVDQHPQQQQQQQKQQQQQNQQHEQTKLKMIKLTTQLSSEFTSPDSPLVGGVKVLPGSDDFDKWKREAMDSAHRSISLERSRSVLSDTGSSLLGISPEDVDDLAKLPVLDTASINECLEARFAQDLIYTRCCDVLISVNPFKDLDIYTKRDMDAYNVQLLAENPHLYMMSARAYSDLCENQRDQVILVSGESGAGKTEATKLLVEHLVYMAGGEGNSLRDKIIKVNPLLENFGNAQTVLNKNSSRFAKFLKLSYCQQGKLQCAKIQDFMLEKTRVVHFDRKETNFHSFYAFLAGFSEGVSLYIEPGQTFRITGDFSTATSRYNEVYKEKYKQQLEVFQLIGLKKEEIEDVHLIMAAILHIGDIEYADADDDCVVIKNEETVQKVANLLDLGREKLTEGLIQRKELIGKGEVVSFSKKKSQAEDERDAFAKTLYEKLFGWLVRKINDSLALSSDGDCEKSKFSRGIGLLDICGFEDISHNSFEQLCINLLNEHLQNFMNKKIIEDEMQLYRDEGVDISGIDTSEINNDAVLDIFTKKNGILGVIDECSTREILASDQALISRLNSQFENNPLYIKALSPDSLNFKIVHYAGKVQYDARGFIKKNRDSLGELILECLQRSQSLLVKDLFYVEPSFTGSISMSEFSFQGSRRGSISIYRPLTQDNLSETINKSNTSDLKTRFGTKSPVFKSSFANKKTHIHYFQNSLKELRRKMESATPYFVRCIKPNAHHQPNTYNKRLVVNQLNYNGISEMARIRRCNLPVRMSKADFVNRYKKLAPEGRNDKAEKIFDSLHIKESSYKVGKSQIFMTDDMKSSLEQDLFDLKRREEEEKARKKREEEEIKRRLREKMKKEKEITNDSQRKQREEDRIQMENVIIDATKSTRGTTKHVLFKEDLSSSSSSRFSDDSGVETHNAATQSTPSLTSQYDSEEEEDSKMSTIEEEAENEWVDHFLLVNDEEIREDLNSLRAMKIVKLVLYILLALLLLGSLIVQKVSFVTLAIGLKDPPVVTARSKDEKAYAYLMLIIALMIPNGFGFIMSLLKLTFGILAPPSLLTWLWVILTESLNVLGICLLVFRVMPHLNYFTAIYILSATVIIPSIIKVFTSDRKEVFVTEQQIKKKMSKAKMSIGFVSDILALAIQVATPILLIMTDLLHMNLDSMQCLTLVASLILVSANQWENFADGTLFGVELDDNSWFKNKVLRLRYELQECRAFPYTLACFMKVGLVFLVAYLLQDDLDTDFSDVVFNLVHFGDDSRFKWAAVALTISGFVAFMVAQFALKLNMKRFSFAIPALLATPCSVLVIYLDCRYQFLEIVPEVTQESAGETMDCLDRLLGTTDFDLLLGGLWLASLVIVCRHVFRKQVEKSGNLARIFINPFYCGVLTTEQLMLNCRRHYCKVMVNYKLEEDNINIKSVWYKIERLTHFESNFNKFERPNEYSDSTRFWRSDRPKAETIEEEFNPKHVTPKVYACATMWHETQIEMLQLLKSLHRLDRDQYLRKLSQKTDVYDPDYYEYEAHILFDDAMELDDDNRPVLNQFVNQLVVCMSEACSSVHGKQMTVHDPVKMATPYGGQLIWKMPGENLLFVHLKDLRKIRNRKRWSQIMYMYYLLDYRLKMFATQEAIQTLEERNQARGFQGLNVEQLNILLGEQHAAMSNKTYILALDGDTDFNSSSVLSLIHCMEDDSVGAACGRIHPIGSGPMIWYQKFEYAIGHWLQKAAEHVFGCVLCSPGCFSLYRARALMDTNVMKRYTANAKEPGERLMFDQGEDRWLCTLLLQRGYKIEYTASADAFTYAPESFFEFYNQRRRWVPSTMANTMDLLGSGDKTRKVNANISLLYIIYTWMLMLMTLLGPGTIIMMIAGAIQLIFEMTLLDAYILSILPAVLLILICFFLNNRWQLIFSALMSAIYAFIMIGVMVSTVLIGSSGNIFHPSVVILVLLTVIFTLTAVCHPKEWTCLVHIVLYFLAVPSGYLVLIIFSFMNLNDISWGTREVPTKAELREREEARRRKEEEKAAKGKRNICQRLFESRKNQIGDLKKFLGNLTNKTLKTETNIQEKTNSILERIEKNTQALMDVIEGRPRPLVLSSSQSSSTKTKAKKKPVSKSNKLCQTTAPSVLKKKCDGSKNMPAECSIKPFWMESEFLGDGTVIKANQEEINFWKGLLKSYLHPEHPTAIEKKRAASGLKQLRNNVAFAFIMVNALWIVFNYLVQATSAARFDVTYSIGDESFNAEESSLGILFALVLLFLLSLQFVAMLIHRMASLRQILSSTRLWGNNSDDYMDKSLGIEDTIRHLNMLLQLPAENDEAGNKTEPPVLASPDDPIGRSVLPRRGDMNSYDELKRSMRVLDKIVNTRRKSHEGPQGWRNQTGIRRHRHKGDNSLETGFGFRNESHGHHFRHHNPLYNHSGRMDPLHWHGREMGHHNLGISVKRLKHLRPNETIIDAPQHNLRRNSQWDNMGALGRTLTQRAQLIEERHKRSSERKTEWAGWR